MAILDPLGYNFLFTRLRAAENATAIEITA
jgi:hypothetical protein